MEKTVPTLPPADLIHVVALDVDGNCVAFNAAEITQVRWEEDHAVLRCFFRQDAAPPLVLEGATADKVWRLVVELRH